jgi:hypothetical protein
LSGTLQFLPKGTPQYAIADQAESGSAARPQREKGGTARYIVLA